MVNGKLLTPIEIAPNTNLVDFSPKPNSKPKEISKLVVNDFKNAG